MDVEGNHRPLAAKLRRCMSRRAVAEVSIAAVSEAIDADVVSFDEIDLKCGWMFGLNNARSPGAEALFPLFLRYARQHPLVARFLDGSKGTALRIEDVSTTRDFERTELYQSFYSRFGIRQQLIAPIAATPSSLISLAAFRQSEPFTEVDLQVMNQLLGLIQSAWDACHRIEMTQRNAFRQLGYEVVSLSGGFGGPPVSEQARQILEARWGPNGWEQQLNAWHKSVQLNATHDGVAPAVWRSEGGVEIRAIRLPDGEPAMAVRLAMVAGPETTGSVWSKLSPREREVAEWLIEGKTSADIAILLSVRESTVRKHLEHIFERLDVSNRATAIRVLLAGDEGRRAHGDGGV
jgi:DNA-binding CsgD family transcriptional regulator